MNTSSNLRSRDEFRASLRERRNELRRRRSFSEEDTRNNLISPFLEHLGYDASRRSAELADRGNTPDEVIYVEPPGTSPSRYCQIILEAKALATDLDRGPSRTETPERQLKRYLRNHQAAGPDTFGILTDGERYRVYQRAGEIPDIRYRGEYNILEPSPQLGGTEADPIDELFEMLRREVLSANSRSRVVRYAAAREITDLISNADSSSTQILDVVYAGSGDVQALSQEGLSGRAQDAYQSDWLHADWRYGPFAHVDNPSLDGSPKVVTACIEFKLPETDTPVDLRRGDVSLAARTFAAKSDCKTAVVIARQLSGDGVVDRARIAVQHLGHTGMTTEFDPHNPPISVLRSIERIVEVLKSAPPVSGQKLSDAVAVKTIRKEFYEAISNWTRTRQRRRDEVHRQAVLRHLIRTVFAWILKEDGIIPNELFEESFAQRQGGKTYHRNVLMFMFHEGLNKARQERKQHLDTAVDEAIQKVPFLNGSLFAEHDGDAGFDLKLEHYFGVSEHDPGLFTIMSRYDWTTTEHTPGESDQTIDPEMLSNLFENLFAATESDQVQKTMPRGTYYTPSDVVAEMVKDALTAATERFTPPLFCTQVLQNLFSDVETELPQVDLEQISDFKRNLLNLSVFDPSVGSGAFLLGVANALANAVKKLDPDAEDPTRSIIQTQLFGQDINPMATQITRLRLFIAIMAAEPKGHEIKPLPNLEGRIVCADTLANVANPDWTFETALGLTGADKKVSETLRERWGVMQMWADAHSEDEKEWVLQQDETTRMRLQEVLRETGNEDHRELMSFANHELLAVDAEPVATDSRLIFYDENRQGFDIVIGNPPYETIAKGRSPAEREAVKNNLSRNKSYLTTKGNNLYNLFCEVALALAKREGSVVTLIVPLSLAFAQAQKETREIFERRSTHIWIRHQDNAPGQTFHESPVLTPANSQRSTIITALLGKSPVSIKTSGTQRWSETDREEFLRYRLYADKPEINENSFEAKLAHQWPRVPTKLIGDLISSMTCQQLSVKHFEVREGDFSIAMPLTARYFITIAPAGKMKRGEIVSNLKSQESLELAMAALNGHITYAWWRVWGDAFHVNKYEITSVAIPDKWMDDASTNRKARQLGRALIDAINSRNIQRHKSGTRGGTFENINFHEACPDIIQQIDELYLNALDLLDDRLLAQLHKLRSNSNWDLD